MQENKTDTITFRTTKELKKALQQMADREKRSLSNIIEMLLETAVKSVSRQK